MSDRSTILEVDKEGNLIFQVQARELPSGVTLKSSSPAPTVVAQKKTAGSDPEDWNAAAGVTIDQIAVVDRIDLAKLPEKVVLASAQAIKFRWKADPDPQPDETDSPVPGDGYRVVVVAERSDGEGDWVAKAAVRINP